MRLAFEPKGWADYQYWLANDKSIVRRLNRLIEETLRDPFSGIGKPEALRFDLEGCWSRRITEEHRLVYMVRDDTLIVLQCRYHYGDAG